MYLNAMISCKRLQIHMHVRMKESSWNSGLIGNAKPESNTSAEQPDLN